MMYFWEWKCQQSICNKSPHFKNTKYLSALLLKKSSFFFFFFSALLYFVISSNQAVNIGCEVWEGPEGYREKVKFFFSFLIRQIHSQLFK